MIKQLGILFCLVLFVFFLSNCGGDGTGGNTTGKDSSSVPTQDSIDEGNLTFYAHDSTECANLGATEFCFKGLSYIKLGDEVTWAQLSVKEGVVKDTVYEEVKMGESGIDSFAWNAKIVDHPDGRVILEADFEEQRYLNRIQIQSPRYKNKQGLHVGSTFRDLKAAFPNLYAFPLANFGVIEVYPSTKLFFHFDLKSIFPADLPEGRIDLSKIPEDARVIRIVVM